MEKVEVIHTQTYRDGGTTEYEDRLNRQYFQVFPTKKVYNQYPFPHGIPDGHIPPVFVKEISVELIVVKSFNQSPNESTQPKQQEVFSRQNIIDFFKWCLHHELDYVTYGEPVNGITPGPFFAPTSDLLDKWIEEKHKP